MSDSLKVLLGILIGAIVVLLFVSTLGGGGMMGGMGSTRGRARARRAGPPGRRG
jgi:hypothetical protein